MLNQLFKKKLLQNCVIVQIAQKSFPHSWGIIYEIQAYVAFNNLLGNFYQGTNTKWILHTYKIFFCIPLKGKLTFKELTLPYQSKNWSSKNCVLRFMKAQMLMKYIFVKF